MDLYESLRSQASPVDIVKAETSYFSEPAISLDPRLFRGSKVIPAVRDGILATLYGHLNSKYADAESWTTVWLAGSGVSYQWSAHRDPGDLDCLIGVDFITFRQANSRFQGLSDREIATMFNEGFRKDLHPHTENFMGCYELTFYVNTATDIRNIKPYSAYSLTRDDWTVEPTPDTVDFPQDWFSKADRDVRMAQDIVSRYQAALNDLTVARNEVASLNARTALLLAVKQGSAMFEDIHGGRGSAFSPSGQGYADFANFRWQSGKASGAVQALRALHKLNDQIRRETEISMYGAELPDASTLVRRAATHYRNH